MLIIIIMVFELEVWQIHWSIAPIIFPSGFAGQGVLNNDLTVWLDGDTPNPKSQSMSSKKLVSWQAQSHQKYWVPQKIYTLKLKAKQMTYNQ